ncbi:MAG TPA: carotenoid oxygenase family protein [Acidimicrobiales bacterium]|nr:carotenoid oxygenase family protein [Acidimicrobiales bacterium]
MPEPASSTSRYLEGGYAPVDREVTVAGGELEVEGRIPPALAGRYLRTGPNPVGEAPRPYHWFLGDGMVHGIELRGGRASWYRNRWVRTAAVSAALGEEPVGGPGQPMYDSSNTNVLGFAGRILSLTEGCYPYVLGPELDTLGLLDAGTLPHGMTAHPKVDPVTGELHAFSYWWEAPFLIYHVLSPDGRVTVTEPIDLPAPVSMHDFAITRDHVLFFDQPAVFDLEAAITTGFPFAWKPENGARVGVLPRGGDAGDIRWFETETCYTFHPMNAYDDEAGGIVVDVPKLSSVFDDDNLVPADGKTQCLERWSIDLAAGKVRSELLDEESQEFCRVNESILGSRHRFGYTIALGHQMPYDDTRVFKHDLRAGTRDVHDFGAGNHPGEFVFVADPDRAGEEDGGWLLGLVHDETRSTPRTSLTILDAQDVTGPPIAQVHVPVRVPFGFHGNWVADER